MPHVELPQAEFKVVMLGDSNTGKTSLVLRFAEGYYRESARSATVGAFFITKRMQVHGITCKIQIWDTAGQEQFKPLAPMYYKNAAAAILCYDVTSPASLRTLKYWLEELHCNVPAGRIVICMAATKVDLLHENNNNNINNNNNTTSSSTTTTTTTTIISPELQQLQTEATQLAQDVGCLYVETSAKTNTNVMELFKVVAERVLQYQQTLKGKAALEIPVTRGSIVESTELTTNAMTMTTTTNNNNNTNATNANSQPFGVIMDKPFGVSTSTTPSRRRVYSTPDATTTTTAMTTSTTAMATSTTTNPMSSTTSAWNPVTPLQQQQQPQQQQVYYSSNDIVNNHRSPFTTPPMSAPSSKTSSPALSAKKVFPNTNTNTNGHTTYYNNTSSSSHKGLLLSSEQAPQNGEYQQHQQQQQSRRDDVNTSKDGIHGVRSASPVSPETGVICGDGPNAMMCGVLLPSSSSQRWKGGDDDDDDDGNHRLNSDGSGNSSCTIL